MKQFCFCFIFMLFILFYFFIKISFNVYLFSNFEYCSIKLLLNLFFDGKNLKLKLFFSSRDGAQNQGRLQFGIYTITPATAIVLASGHCVVTIDCAPEAPGKYEEDLVIDIVDRNMQEYPNGIPYRLCAEATYPSIVNTLEIFEEHTIVPNISALDPKLVIYFRLIYLRIYAEIFLNFFIKDGHWYLCRRRK